MVVSRDYRIEVNLLFHVENESMQACRVLRNSATTARTGTGITRLARSRTLANVASGESHESESRNRVSILLQKTASLLPRTLSTADNAVGPESSAFWSDILERSITELSSGSDQVPLKATIAGKRFCDCGVHPFIPDCYPLGLVLALMYSLWSRQVGLFT